MAGVRGGAGEGMPGGTPMEVEEGGVEPGTGEMQVEGGDSMESEAQYLQRHWGFLELALGEALEDFRAAEQSAPPPPPAPEAPRPHAQALDVLFRQFRAEDGWRMLVRHTLMADRVFAVGSVLRWHDFERALGGRISRQMLEWIGLQVGTRNVVLVLAPRAPLSKELVCTLQLPGSSPRFGASSKWRQERCPGA